VDFPVRGRIDQMPKINQTFNAIFGWNLAKFLDEN
jgi:hypothetical protein